MGNGQPSVRPDCRTCSGALGRNASVVSQRSDETARPMPAPVDKSKRAEEAGQPEWGVCFNRGFWPVWPISSQSPRETMGGCSDVDIVVMLVEARQGFRETCSSPSSCVCLDNKVGRSREFRACSTFSNTVQADRVSRFIKRPGCTWSRPAPLSVPGVPPLYHM